MTIHKPPFVIHQYPSLPSTNDHLKSLLEAPEFTVIVADEQTAGRGRRQRIWHSSPGDGLYFSVLLRPESFTSSLALISLFAGIAVAEALVHLGVAGVDIKWPNDVLISGRKVSGILSEGASSAPSAARVIVGIGVNLNHASFPAELEEAATSVFMTTGQRIEMSPFLDQLLDRLRAWYEVWAAGGDMKVIARWEELSSYAFGQQVRVTTDEEELDGLTQGLATNGGLVVRTASGQLRTILAGEVSRLRKQDRLNNKVRDNA
ncbi:MAG: biotin--[acetyl-CoA-carboxylase] ligase [Acidobacteriota bacterium]